MNITYKALVTIMVSALLLYSCNLLYAGENTWTTEGPFGASVITIAINPDNNNIILIGTIQNGIYKSTDFGENWRHIDSDIMERNQREIVYNPIHPDTVFTATAAGVYRSEDGGETWQNISPPGRENQEFRVVVIDPLHPNALLIGGVWDRWKSTDSGNSWNVFVVNPDLPGGMDHEVDAIAVDPINTNIAYLTTPDAESGWGVYKSTNFGDTWGNIQNNSDSCAFGKDIAVDPTNPEILYYAKDSNGSNSCHYLLKSTNSGDSWVDITPDSLGSRGVDVIKISPVDHNVVFIATVTKGILKSTDGGQSWAEINNGLDRETGAYIELDAVNGNLYLGIYSDGIYKSTDVGATWRRISHNITAANSRSFAFFADSTYTPLTAINRSIYIRNNSTFEWQRIETEIGFGTHIKSICTDRYIPGRVYLAVKPSAFLITTDNGQNWEVRGESLPQYGFFESMAVSYGVLPDRRIFIAANGLYFTDDLGQHFEICDGGLPLQDYGGVYSSSYNPDYIAATDLENRIYISTDRGNNWEETSSLPRYSDFWLNDFTFDPNNCYHIFASTPIFGLFESYDLGDNWFNITNDLPASSSGISNMGPAINPYNSANMFVFSAQKGIYQTFDGGLHWNSFNDGLDTSFWAGYLYFAPDDTARLYLATFDHSVWSIHRTLDGVEDDTKPLPRVLSLSSYPNPFNPTATISYSLPKTGHVILNIYNIMGQKVATILDSYQQAGEHSIIWDASEYSSGLYFASLECDNQTKIGKLILLK
jgi:photosystem II stability/assembly factor-like uncharacterized protein